MNPEEVAVIEADPGKMTDTKECTGKTEAMNRLGKTEVIRI